MSTTAIGTKWARIQAGSLCRHLIHEAAVVFAGALFVGLLAQLSIPLWPVAITGQTLGVMVVGATLGSKRGGAALSTYAVGGLAGIPWFAEFSGGLSYLLKPSFGFIIGFICTAWVVGRWSEKQGEYRPGASLVAFGAASVLPFAVGVPWMWLVLHFSLGMTLGFWQTLQTGVLPFIPGGIIKWLLAVAIMAGVWKITNRPAKWESEGYAA